MRSHTTLIMTAATAGHSKTFWSAARKRTSRSVASASPVPSTRAIAAVNRRRQRVTEGSIEGVIATRWRPRSPKPPLTCNHHVHCAPGQIRTADTRFRRAVLYPLSYRRSPHPARSGARAYPGAPRARARCRTPQRSPSVSSPAQRRRQNGGGSPPPAPSPLASPPATRPAAPPSTRRYASSRPGTTRYVRPRGVVHSNSPGATWRRRAPPWVLTWWSRRHRGPRLPWAVGPSPRSHSTVWSRSQRSAAAEHPGRAHQRSRDRTCSASAAGGR